MNDSNLTSFLNIENVPTLMQSDVPYFGGKDDMSNLDDYITGRSVCRTAQSGSMT